jgi:hypothetical protein
MINKNTKKYTLMLDNVKKNCVSENKSMMERGEVDNIVKG